MSKDDYRTRTVVNDCIRVTVLSGCGLLVILLSVVTTLILWTTADMSTSPLRMIGAGEL